MLLVGAVLAALEFGCRRPAQGASRPVPPEARRAQVRHSCPPRGGARRRIEGDRTEGAAGGRPGEWATGAWPEG